MTVPATTRRAGPYNGNSVTTSFPFTFKVFAAGDIEVRFTSVDLLESVLVLDSGYTVTLNPDQNASPGGTVTYPISGTALAAGEKLTLIGALEYEQPTDLPPGGAYRSTTVEDALDRATIQIQQLAEEVGRSLVLPPSAANTDTTLPPPVAGKIIGWNSTADALVNLDTADLASVVVSGSAYTNIFNGTGAQTAFALTANPGSVNALDIAISGVSQVNGVDFTVSGTTLTFVDAPPAGTGNVVVRYVAALPVGSANSQDITHTTLGSRSRTLAAMLNEQDQFATSWPGIDMTGTTDSAAALQTALDYVGLNRLGRLRLPPGVIRLNSEVAFNYSDTELVGAGSSFENITEAGITLLRGHGVVGSVLRVKKAGCRIADMVISANATRQALAYTSGCHGIQVEGNDIASQSVKRQRIENVRVTRQPGSGVVLVGDILSSTLFHVDVDYSGAHAFVITGGAYTGRTNVNRPGQIRLENCRGSRSGGHGLVVGDTVDNSTTRPYRVDIVNFESFFNGTNAAAKIVDYDWFIQGENIESRQSACNGEKALGVPDHGGIYVLGQNIKILSHRFVDCDVIPARVVDGGAYPTTGVEIEVDYVEDQNGSGPYNPAVVIDPGCVNTVVTSRETTNITSLASSAGINTTINWGGVYRFFGEQVAGNLRSITAASLADDNAGYYTFTAACQGIAVISSNLLAGGSALFWFRTGDASAAVTPLPFSGGPTITGAAVATAATVTDAYGTDTQLIVVAAQDQPRLYLSNRTGASRTYTLTILSCTSTLGQTFTQV